MKADRGIRRLFPTALIVGYFSAAANARADTHAAIKPVPRSDKGWRDRHSNFLKIAKSGNVDLLFLGDSITQGWEGAGKEVWKERFEPLKAANFGIGGDQTQHVLWRLHTGNELHGITPKIVVLVIGTNNMGSHSAEQIAEGVTAIVAELQHQLPHGKVLLLGVFPRSAKAKDAVRAKIKSVNERIAKLDDGKQVRYLDIGDKFLQTDGTLTKEIMPDYLHLSPQGYKIWADSIQPTLSEMLK